MDSSRIAWNCLRLVYPPVSSLDAESLISDAKVKEALKQSKFYLIGKRPQVFFGPMSVSDPEMILTFTLKMTLDSGDTIEDYVEIDLNKLPTVAPYDEIVLSMDLGGKFLSIHKGDADGIVADRATLLDWFTTEKLLYDRWRGKPGMSGLNLLRKYTSYDLLYVGISKQNDTGIRLFSGSHEARQRILNNEFSTFGGGRISEEIYLFAFDIEPVSLRTLAPTDRLTGHPGGPEMLDKVAVVADAEKAFIDLLDTKYNREKYSNYPKGEDGLYSAELSGYLYQIAEDITFVAKKGTFRGARDRRTEYPSNQASALVIRNDVTTVFDPPDSHADDNYTSD